MSKTYPLKKMVLRTFDDKGVQAVKMTLILKGASIPDDSALAHAALAAKVRAWSGHDGIVTVEYNDPFGTPIGHVFGAHVPASSASKGGQGWVEHSSPTPA